MTDASEADRLEQAQELDEELDGADVAPRIDEERSEADAIEQAQLLPDEPDPGR